LDQIQKLFSFKVFDSLIQFENFLYSDCQKVIPLLSDSIQKAKSGQIFLGLKDPLPEKHKDIFHFFTEIVKH
jgi:hypothetical protein